MNNIAWNRKWYLDSCRLEALKYDTRKSFAKNSSGAYSAAQKNRWLDDICSHMKRYGDRKNRCIYSYEFPDNFVYVGLTYNIDAREICRKSRKNDAVTKHINNTGLQPARKILTNYIPIEEAIKKEDEHLKKYIKNGWKPLNRIKTGGVGGGNVIWTKERCWEEALKYEFRNEFKKHSSSAYRISIKNRWLSDICSHMKNKYNKLTKEDCRVEALKYKTINKFRKNSNNAYVKICTNKWIDELCSHMIRKKKKNNYWTKERCILEAKKYKTLNEFRKNKHSAYVTVVKNNWFNEISFLEKYKQL